MESSDREVWSLLSGHGLDDEQIDRLRGNGPRCDVKLIEEAERLGWLQGSEAQTIVSELIGLPLHETIRPDEVSLRFIEAVPIAFARRFGVIGLQNASEALTVVVGETGNLHVAEKIAVLLGLPVRVELADPADIAAAINRAYGRQTSDVENVIGEIADAGEVEGLLEAAAADDLLDNTGHAPVIKLVNLILFEAVKRRASDVHIQPYSDRLQVRLRIDGVLYDYVRPPKHLQDAIVSRVKVLGRMNIAEKRLPQDGRTTVSVGDKLVDLRISSLPTCHGERIVLRLLDKSARLYELPELGMGRHDLERFRRLVRHSYGIILVTGPTGSGKSTTLYAALQYLNSKEKNILTLEDPIEYQLPGISQTQVAVKKGMTFASGLRTVLRQDPDVIMVGEIRDEETARMAVQSSLTGHLVFSTLHTNDAAGALARLLDLGVEPYLVASSLIGVLAQRLIRRVCPECKELAPLTEDQRRRLGISDGNTLGTVSVARGCDHCSQTGYFERVGVFELLVVSDAVREVISERTKSARIKAAAVAQGMKTLKEDGIDKLRAGVTTAEEVLRLASYEDADAGQCHS